MLRAHAAVGPHLRAAACRIGPFRPTLQASVLRDVHSDAKTSARSPPSATAGAGMGLDFLTPPKEWTPEGIWNKLKPDMTTVKFSIALILGLEGYRRMTSERKVTVEEREREEVQRIRAERKAEREARLA
mmetsp:Transcript_120226/g.221122  ORF Transcript_120226/g.221122 Transcript_120226/m.221122 type:complete len:130 (-) Transcript_120226:22-411(-)